jgi:2OG-Fe(II) oxygenase superfamily
VHIFISSKPIFLCFSRDKINQATLQKDIGGLQILLPSTLSDPGPTWLDVPVIEDGILVNVGDLFDFWTGGKFKSTQHRVVTPRTAAEAQGRFSIAYFLWVLAGAAVLVSLYFSVHAVPSAIPPTPSVLFEFLWRAILGLIRMTSEVHSVVLASLLTPN